MSGQYSEQALAQAYSQYLVQQDCFLAVSCLVFYEFVITIGDEINIVWKRPVTVSAVLLGSLRWCMVLTIILQLIPETPNACAPLNILGYVFLLIGFLQTAVFSALRVFAIWNRSYLWSLIVFALSMVSFVMNLIDAAVTKYVILEEPIWGAVCASEYPFSVRTTNILIYSTRGSVILADTIVLVLTWIKTFRHWRNARRVNLGVSLTTCLLRDGQALLAINIAELVTFDPATDTSPVGAFITSLPLVLINRFMINLRTVDSEMSDDSTYTTDRQQESSTVQFRRSTNRLGNIGGALLSGLDDDESSDQEDMFNAADEVEGYDTGLEM
ncbi:uncharacterized protein PHACADRAFT_251424 [Phanerochaete carnosa HHB-10118-sp]|uniref:DUF6533 domain-containing protein n=1 Tax=Phanerochaete carnosa (strain HHB-10118-sp) TaxID=650164 RepID=K5WEC9_PHACS|nr:uncharacterized protein PHACADRAFT_251424 [Phanerochaete carnosa HHB-10118-sp]EKM57660.1 hypothetical protein PHACADRAFT_251424 [Phanerochaete carnosa HHB-10118-sp]